MCLFLNEGFYSCKEIRDCKKAWADRTQTTPCLEAPNGSAINIEGDSQFLVVENMERMDGPGDFSAIKLSCVFWLFDFILDWSLIVWIGWLVAVKCLTIHQVEAFRGGGEASCNGAIAWLSATWSCSHMCCTWWPPTAVFVHWSTPLHRVCVCVFIDVFYCDHKKMFTTEAIRWYNSLDGSIYGLHKTGYWFVSYMYAWLCMHVRIWK